MEIQIVKQLAIFLENQPGALYRLTQDFAENKISIKALAVMDSVDHAVVRLIVDKPIEAIHLLEETGVLVVENDLLEIPLKNIPGQITSLCKQLVDMGINIEYAYGSAVPNSTQGVVYLRVKEIDKVFHALKQR